MSTAHQDPDIESMLRGELAARADSLPVGGAPVQAVGRAVRRDRFRRRAGVAGSLALAVALTAVLPSALGGRHAGQGVHDASGGGAPALFTAPLRGNLADDAAFLSALEQRLDGVSAPDFGGSRSTAAAYEYKPLYVNDDGVHRMVIAGVDEGTETGFTVLVGAHGSTASALKVDPEFTIELIATPQMAFTYVGPFAGKGGEVPYVVLGPPQMTAIEYSTEMTLETVGGKLKPVRTAVKQAATLDGAAAGEIGDPTTLDGAARLSYDLMFRAELGGSSITPDSNGRTFLLLPANRTLSSAYAAIMAAVAQQGRLAGLHTATGSPSRHGIGDDVAMVLLDAANFAGVPLDSVGYHVDWIGRETPQWDSALVDVTAPGLPNLQIFVRGLAAGAPWDALSDPAIALVRPATSLSPGHLPHTGSAFGGQPEYTTMGLAVPDIW